MKWQTERLAPKMTEAQEKLKQILKKAQSLGVEPDQMIRLATTRKLQPPSSRSFLLSSLPAFLPIVFLIYGLGLQRSAIDVFHDWRVGGNSPRQCAVAVPDTFNRIFRPPVQCSVCEGITKIDKVSAITIQDFEEKYAYSGRPVIVTDATDNWTAPAVFSYEFFQSLYKDRVDSLVSQQCQFFPYKTSFNHLGEFLNITTTQVERTSPWYVGWSNCDMEVTELLRQHYDRPYFLPSYAEGKRLDWVFMGSKGYGAPMHVDNVEYPSWQAQLRGRKKWSLQPPPECLYVCESMDEIVETGETIVLDTNRWYHSTEIVSDEVSITIGAEFD